MEDKINNIIANRDGSIADLFRKNIESYITWRKSSAWDEAYKWDILIPLSEKLNTFTSINTENVAAILELYQKNNPTQGSWTTFHSFDDATKAIEQGKSDQIARFIDLTWQNKIDEAADMFRQATGKAVSTSTLGYLLAAKNPAEYPLYRGEFYGGLKDDLNLGEPGTLAERYTTYRNFAVTFGERLISYLREYDQGLYEYHKDSAALTGQDFLYHMYYGRDKNRILRLVNSFVKDADNGELRSKAYNMQYNGFKVKVSFGMGALAKVPWVGFSMPGHTTAINLLYFKEANKLILVYGVPEEKEPSINWNLDNQTLSEHYTNEFKPSRYGNSLFISEYDPHNIPDSVIDDLNKALGEYKRQTESEGLSGIYTLLKKFIEHTDSKQNTRNEFKGEYRDTKYRAWFGTSNKTYLETTWMAFGKDNNERGSVWDDNRIVILYNQATNKLAIIYRWQDTNGLIKGVIDPLLADVDTSFKWDDWNCRAIYEDAHNLPKEVEQTFNKLIDEYHNLGSANGDKIMSDQTSLNTILYGPPGTGKTYNAINKFAADLLSHQAATSRSEEEVLADKIKDLTWWQVTALSLYQGGGYMKVADLARTPIVNSYAKFVKNRTTNIKPTLWATLQERSDEGSSNASSRIGDVEYFNKNSDSEWGLTDDGKAYVEQALSDIELDVSAEQGSDWRKFYRTITFHQSYSYEEFVEGIRPILNPEEQTGQISYEIKDGIFKEMSAIARRDPDNKYLLIIDEINRGNISKIFGELITLLEEDKRESLTVRLPYSQEEFSVPDNLYVLGTMNTADRSIALLDIALRRRFVFKEMMPEYSLISQTIDGVDLAQLLQSINERIEVMTDRDHQIGHSYFMGITTADQLHAAWYHKIVPLLCEYFYNDWERLKDIVGKYTASTNTGFIDQKDPRAIQALFPKDKDYSEAVIGSIHEYTPDQLPNALKAIYEQEPQTD